MDQLELHQFCKLLLKVELHAHLNGSLSEETLRELDNLDGGKPSWKNFSTLNECFQIFDIAHKLTKNAAAVSLATLNTIREFAEDNVIYLELRSTPRSEANMTKSQYVRAIINGIETAQNQYLTITVRLIVSINRKESTAEASENIDLAIKLSEEFPQIVVGVDLSGNPALNDFLQLRSSLQRAKEAGLKVAVHCGEIPNVKEIQEVIDFGVDRIGHGTCIHPMLGGSVENWNKLLSSGTPVEVCLTSNLRCKTIESITNSHLGLLIASSHPFALCTDDKGVFNTSLSEEYFLAGKAFNLSKDALWDIAAKSMDYSFASCDVKDRVKQKLNTFRDRM